MKTQRQKVIADIIATNQIDTQSALMGELKKRGVKVTQGTLSRDIREMGVVKTSVDGRSVYAISSEGRNNKAKYDSIIKHSVIKADYAGNIVVVTTYSGMANAAGAAIDSLYNGMFIGSIAGDDTLMIVVKNEEDAITLCEKINGTF